MDNYLIDRETLGKFVDELIKNKALSVGSTAELSALREEAIRSLDDKIGLAIFGQFTQAQNEEYNQLLDYPGTTQADFQSFFTNHHIDVEKTITDAMQAFGAEFLGGQDA